MSYGQPAALAADHLDPAPKATIESSDAGPGDGEAVRGLWRAGHRYVAWIRLVTLVPTAVVGLVLAGSTPSPIWAWASMSALVLWSLVYARMLIHRPRTWVTVTDAAVLAGMAMATELIVPVSWLGSGKSWLLPFLAFACACYQYYAGLVLGSAAAAAVVAAAVVGTARAVPPGGSFDSIHTAIWTIVLVGLARVFWTLVMRGGRLADRSLADTVRAQSDQVLAREIRAEQLEHNRRLHDTAATTLLMVGLGQAGHIDLLRAQARRDVIALCEHTQYNHRGAIAAARTDLVEALQAAIDVSPLTVDLQCPAHVDLPGPAVWALAGAAGEALGNVARHTDTDACRIVVSGDDTAVRVQIIDTGKGFDPAVVSDRCRGVRDSIRGRMAGAGGLANITSQRGSGTSVTLEWPDVGQ